MQTIFEELMAKEDYMINLLQGKHDLLISNKDHSDSSDEEFDEWIAGIATPPSWGVTSIKIISSLWGSHCPINYTTLLIY